MEPEAASNTVEAVSFSFYTSEEAKALSVKEISRPESLDRNRRPLPSGVNDPALGVLDESSRQSCITCGKSGSCVGHFGHINLVRPVYNPLLVDTLRALLQRTCFSCFHFKESNSKVGLFISQLKLIAKGDVAGAKSLDPELSIDSLSREGSSACDVSSSTEIFDCSADSFLPSKRLKWSSLQFNEAMSVLHKFLGSKDKNQSCSNCKAENPTITIDTFGWFHKTDAIKIQHFLMLGLDGLISVLAGRVSAFRGFGSHTMSVITVIHQRKTDLMHVSNQELSSRVLSPLEVKEIMERLWENESVFFSYMNDIQHHGYVEHASASMFFLETILVPPNKFRPFFYNNDRDSVTDSWTTQQLSNVLKDNIFLTAQDTFFEERTMIDRWIALQKSVNILFGDRNRKGIRKLLERKQGILRWNMMGKNTNYFCRSVIYPDPYLAVNEIGIPEHFALTLTYPERVTPWNVPILRDAILNGAEIYPGATHYYGDSDVCNLNRNLSRCRRLSIARKLCTSRGLTRAGNISNEPDSQIVYRHLRDGDVVLVNAQPALHKASIMAHVVRVIRGEKTIRMHYANCSAYGVNFDGDEMNVHVPQDDISRAEAFSILNANEQYVSSIDGLPLKGLIQDHIVSAALLTKKDTFLRYHEFTQLCYSSIASATRTNFYSKHDKKVAVIYEDNWMCPSPAILKPEPLWTGKQVISVVLQRLTKGFLPFTMERRVKLPSDFFKRKISGNTEKSMQRKDTEVKRDNYHRRTVFYKQLKDHRDTQVVSNHEKFKRSQEPGEDTVVIFNNYLVSGVIDKAQFGSYGLVHTFQELYGSDSSGILILALGRLFTAFLQMHGFTCGVDDLLLEKDADKRRKKQLDECARCGLEVNCELVGVTDTENLDPVELQMKIEEFIHSNGESALTNLDKRMISKLNELSNNIQKDLSFRGLLKPTAKNCFSLMTTSGAQGGTVNFQGISSHLHQQEFEGKRVPRMSSGKTLPSFPPWDWEARAGGFIADRYLTGLRPQEYYFHCMAGREGLVDTAIKTPINAYLLRCLIKNLESLQVSYDRTVRDADGSIIQFYYGEDGVDVEKASFLTNFDVLSANHELMKVKLSSYDGDGYIKGVPLSLQNKMMEWTSGKSPKIYKSVEDFMKLVKHKYFSSLAQPGEAVGILAAQSIGKPATQMMLNNNTLGTPRLLEVLMTASAEIKSPIMKCPLRKGMSMSIFSDDIRAVQKRYGIEAARESIMKELQHVLSSNGVLVDFRHLSLIADFMTHSGKYLALNSRDLIAQSISPLSKMTFEASTEFVSQAALHGNIDYLRTPSASICLGQIVKMGTGVIDILQKIEKFEGMARS